MRIIFYIFVAAAGMFGRLVLVPTLESVMVGNPVEPVQLVIG
ncbi:MAG: hypothetical protein ABR535_09860 [Pyrinomonadaceae bacterium]